MSLFKKAKTSPFPTGPCPIDIVESILFKLPVKSLLRFRCVEKSWNSLISNPQFARRHLREFNRHNLFIKFNEYFCFQSYPLCPARNAGVELPPEEEYPPPLKDMIDADKVVGSCDGIICISLFVSNTFLLWNPSIRTFTESPPLEQMMIEDKSIAHWFGFGYDNLTQTYKVVSTSFYEDAVQSSGVMVHTVGTDCWKRIDLDFPSLPEDETGKFLNGTLNWVTTEHPDYQPCIVSFDLGTETYQLLDLPAELPVKGLMLGVLRDYLSIYSHNDTFCDVWIMKEHLNDKSWTKVLSIPLYIEGVFRPYRDFIPVQEPRYISEDSRLVYPPLPSLSNLVVSNYGDNDEKLYKIFDIQYGSAWMVLSQREENPDSCDEPKVFAESLISPCPLNNRM